MFFSGRAPPATLAGVLALFATSAAAELRGIETLIDRRFRAAVAYYPYCTSAPAVSVPTLIMIGERDDWSSAECGDGAPVKLVVYPDAYHDINFQFARPITFLGHHLEHNESARAAWAEMVAALREAFGR